MKQQYIGLIAVKNNFENWYSDWVQYTEAFKLTYLLIVWRNL